MIAELVDGVSSLGVNKTNDNRPKHALPRTRFNSSKQLISGRRQGRQGRTLSVEPQQGSGRIGLPFHKYIPLKEPCLRPLMLSVGRDIVIDGEIWRRQPGSVLSHPPPAFLNHVAPCNHSISVSAKREARRKSPLTPFFFGASGLHYLDGLLHQSIQSAQRVLDTLPSN